MHHGKKEKEFVETAKERTGKPLAEWLQLVKSSGIEKRNDMLEWLKRVHGLNHMQAQLVTGIHLNNGILCTSMKMLCLKMVIHLPLKHC